MTSGQHQLEAERLLKKFRDDHEKNPPGSVYTITPLELTEALVHATLAVSSAMIERRNAR